MKSETGNSQTMKAFVNQGKELGFYFNFKGKAMEGFRQESDMVWFVYLKYLGLLWR